MRQRISWLVVATTSTVVVSFVIPLCLLVRTLAEDRAMAVADQEARNVAIVVARLQDDPQLAGVVADIEQRGTPRTDVLLAGGRQLGGGPEMAGSSDVQRALDGDAFSSTSGQGGRVLLPVVVADGTAVVRTTVTEDDLRHGVLGAWAGIIGLGIVLLGLALAIAARLGKRISEPLLEVAGTAHQLREGDLSARAEVSGTEETRELARALNGLAERTGELLASERAAVGDLSHRLRTPVTALRMDAEAVADPELAGRLQEHIAVLQRSIDAIVREARRPVRRDLSAVCDATAVVRERVEFWRALAEDQGRRMGTLLPTSPLRVPLASEDLTDLVDVVIDNVFAHTPEGTQFQVDLRQHGPELGLLVLDAGPGFSPAGRTERTGSTGLGLDIVTRLVTEVGGSLRTGSGPEGGALVEVTIPLAPE
jgi:signal transduction histidine kinase